MVTNIDDSDKSNKRTRLNIFFVFTSKIKRVYVYFGQALVVSAQIGLVWRKMITDVISKCRTEKLFTVTGFKYAAVNINNEMGFGYM